MQTNRSKRLALNPICRKCKEPLTDENWYAPYRKVGKRNYICKKCASAYSIERGKISRAKWSEERIEEWRKKNRKANRRSTQKLRYKVIDMYGGVCTCCGEDRIEFLVMDHIGGGGNKHRRELGRNDLYKEMHDNFNPGRYQVLCHNCNMSLAFNGYCPHEVEQEKADAS